MSIVGFCDNGRDHEGRLFHLVLDVREVGATHKSRQRGIVSLGHFCEACLKAEGVKGPGGRSERVLQFLGPPGQ